MKIIKKIKNKYTHMNLVAKASVWFIFVTIIDKSISILTQPFINRLLSKEEVGIYGVFQSYYSIFTILATFYLFCGILEVYLTKNKENQNEIVASLMSLSLTISIIVFSIVLIFIRKISLLTGLKASYIIVMIFMIISETIIQFWIVPKRFSYSYKLFSMVTISLFFVKTCLSLFFAYFWVEDRLLGRLFGLTLPSTILAIIFGISIFYKSKFKNIFFLWKKALLFNIPLLPHYLSNILLSSSDRIMIEKLTGASSVGIYTVAYSLASLSLIVFSAINNAYNPFAMKALKEKNYNSLQKITIIILFVSILFSLILIYLAPEGLWILGGNDYLEGIKIIPVLVIGIFFSSFYYVFSNVEFMYEKTKLIFPITTLGTLVNIGLNFWLIPKLGYVAAAYTTLIGYVIIAVCHYLYSRFLIKEDIFNLKKIIFLLILFIFFSFLAIPLYTLHPLFRYSFIVVFTIFFCFVLFKNKRTIFTLNKKQEKK